MRLETTTHLTRVLADHVLPTLASYQIKPVRIELHWPDLHDQATRRDCNDAHGDGQLLAEVPDAVLEVQLRAVDWGRLFLPVHVGGRQEVREAVDICDPCAAPYCMENPPGIGERWTVARVDCVGGKKRNATFRAMDGAYPGLIWLAAGGNFYTYHELDTLVAAHNDLKTTGYRLT